MSNYNVTHMFHIPLITIQCDRWKQKKDAINSLPSKLKTYNDTGVRTDYHTQLCEKNFNYNDIVEKIFNDEIVSLCGILRMSKSKVVSSWIQSYKFKTWHETHNHGALGYSAVCYVDFDENEHKATQFISPFNNFMTGDILTYTPTDIKEGMITFFPSSIHHQAAPNMSKKVRKILSFNLSLS